MTRAGIVMQGRGGRLREASSVSPCSATLAAVLLLAAGAAFAQAPAAGSPVEADPVRCWWRTDHASITMGEPFTAVLTCAALETPSTKVVVDRSRLDPTVMALPPFDVLSGSTAEDAVTASRRFFQYTYQLRLLNDTAFGQDLKLQGLTIGYRIDTATGEGTTSQGRDQTYVLPALTIRVLSLVANDARDIRDATSLTFGDLESRRFRARVLRILGWLAYALAGAVAALGLAKLYAGMRVPAAATTNLVSDRAILKGAGRQLAEVSRERQSAGWTDDLVGRASAALRVVASYAIGRPAAQLAVARTAEQHDGQFLLSDGWIRRRRALVSAAVTPQDLAAGTGQVQAVSDGLASVTASRFGRAALDEGALDAAISTARGLADSLAFKELWPLRQWRKLTGAIARWQGAA